MKQFGEPARFLDGLEHQLPVAAVLGRGQDLHGLVQQESESGQTFRQLKLFQLTAGVFDPGLQVGLMLPGLLQGEAVVSGHSGHVRADQ
jgi:hypothetical protein